LAVLTNSGISLPAALDETLDAALEGGARQQHLAVAGRAADADLGAKPYHAPSIAATRVRLAHLNEITEVYVDWRLWHNNGKLRVESEEFKVTVVSTTQNSYLITLNSN
jgi:hypothetical protein